MNYWKRFFLLQPKKTKWQLQLEPLELGLQKVNSAMSKMGEAVKEAQIAIDAFYKPLYEAKPRNWRHKKKLMNRKEVK